MIKASDFIGLLVIGGLTDPAVAAGATEGDWPCIQRKVPELSAGAMWGGPPIDETAANWRSDAEVRSLVNLLSIRRTTLEDAEAKIQAFSEALEGTERSQRLVQTFAGLLENANAERAEILKGIERYTRKQRRLADGIQQKRQALETVLKIEAPTAADDERRRALEQELNWQTRIHEDREKSLTYVCEIPVLLEQRLFALARMLANQIN